MELIEVVLSKENLNRAYKKIVANRGAGGVDGVTVEELGSYIRENREKIVTSLRNRTYIPKDGLTCVREGDSRMYLMDNIEVLACYQDLQCLADRTAGLEEIAEEAGARAEKTGAAILEQLWNAEAFRYEVGAQTGGDMIRSKHPERFYPDGGGYRFTEWLLDSTLQEEKTQ